MKAAGFALERASDYLDILCRIIASCLIAIIALLAAAQVGGRYFIGWSPVWIEEMTRYCFIWMTLLGACVLVKRGEHAVIDVLVSALPRSLKSIHTALVLTVIIATSAVLIFYGIKIVGIVGKQLSPALRLSMAYVYLAVPVSGAIITVHCVVGILAEWRRGEE
ncbi:TRAP transporter small permease [Oceanibacterium hippocampi]|uniref:TRAP transporter small permease protein n=1 Tax=Oceanibacterium hippocampi TaxID=745714 RepID=A0A1Y5TJC4_9PROT|nr:TRAP transporter small permease [Oceanibacterium hippocampi]SLN65505.1 Sialic acid TRAP transporter permease protein SiaT [Oceanibacterium hippocampi]